MKIKFSQPFCLIKLLILMRKSPGLLVLTQKNFDECRAKTRNGSQQEVHSLLLDTDLRELACSWFTDARKQDVLESCDRIAQIVRIRNIAIPQADEDYNKSQAGGSRLFRLLLTDGRNSLPALDLDNSEKLSSGTPPGTKLRLIGNIPIVSGFLLLRKSDFQVLGGEVANLVKEWTMNKLGKDLMGRHTTGAPPFVPFGSPEASALVQSQNVFLRSLLPGKNNAVTFDSFKIASHASTVEKENDFDASFQERRKGVISELSGDHKSAADRFHAGGSRFSDLQAAKLEAHDESLARLVSQGYPVRLADTALKISKGDYQAAVDYLLAKQMSAQKIDAGGGDSQRRGIGRGKRGRRGRRDFDPEEEDDPRFDPSAAMAATGLQPRPSAIVIPLDEVLNPRHRASNQSSQVPQTSASRTTSTLPFGCPILAQNMLGNYEEAQLIGYITPAGSIDKVVLVVYGRNQEGTIAEEEELVPLSLIRTLGKERITIDMIPPAPPHRAKPYMLHSNSLNNSDSMPANSSYPTNFRGTSRHRGGSRGRSRGRRGYRR